MPGQTHRTPVQIRFSDTDALGHINNASYATYAEIARLHFLEVLGTSVRSLILANLAIDFRRQVKVGDEVHVVSWIEKLGTSSMSMSQTIYANDEVAADIRSVVVHFDYGANKSAPLTDEMRGKLAPYMRQ